VTQTTTQVTPTKQVVNPVTQKVAQSTAITLIATDREKLDKIKAL
jgi:hypothetical protein